MANLDLNTSEMVAVYDAVILILKNNATLKRMVKTWRAHGARSPDKTPHSRLTSRCRPCESPRWNGPEEWRYPNAMVGPLYLGFEILLLGADVRDALNLSRAIQIAIYPGGAGTLANIQALQAAGAQSGLPQFTVPAYDESPDGANLLARGQMKIDVLFQLPN